uniref:Uncharacterized protein n=1 Tax=Syphacia muris TaxID=451379 RepID=A0A0N5AM54_9BILA
MPDSMSSGKETAPHSFLYAILNCTPELFAQCLNDAAEGMAAIATAFHLLLGIVGSIGNLNCFRHLKSVEIDRELY